MGRDSRINPMGRRILTGFEDELNFSSGRVVVDDAVDITDDMVLAFFDGDEQPSSSSGEDGDEDEEMVENLEERKAFWENQHQLLHATITKSSPLESNIRNATKQALKEAKLTTGSICRCGILVDGCRNCMLRHVSDHLCAASFDAAICKSKWRSSKHIPSGEHVYVDVMDNNSTKSKKKGEFIRVVIELNFRAEFEMARANNEYNQLSSRLPEVFVGKAERLRAVIKIMCGAAKKCMKENKMHMGPWRKQKYMEAKWFGICERTSIFSSLKQAFSSCQSTKPRTSLLSFNLVDRLPTMHCTAVEVL
ncbi:hypothetical protein C5167_043212 [Papaver somniferum]|uniref:Uncharacterized protein n=1 Tax=Papaver somniferum TaxID=3469 RepID=A0A4Y7L531_PAPSO|nr:uncharacterized protein LOC113317176 [Papaver somniferum]RZC80644.1 hypothetical protein C5167_043212 [Papaver somniferum]